MFETSIIQPKIENKNLVGYWRNVDDVLVIVKKGYDATLLGFYFSLENNLEGVFVWEQNSVYCGDLNKEHEENNWS